MCDIPISNLSNINADRYKLHAARAYWTDKAKKWVEPLDIFVRDKDEWINWNRWRRGKSDFTRRCIFSLIDFYPETRRRGAHHRAPGVAGVCLRVSAPGRVRRRAQTTARPPGARPARLTRQPARSPCSARRPCRERRPLAQGMPHTCMSREKAALSPDFYHQHAQRVTFLPGYLPCPPHTVGDATTDSLFIAL